MRLAILKRIDNIKSKLGPNFIMNAQTDITKFYFQGMDLKKISTPLIAVSMVVGDSLRSGTLLTLFYSGMNLKTFTLIELYELLEKYEGIVTSLELSAEKPKDRKLVTKSLMSFLRFVKDSYKDHSKIEPQKFFEQPMPFALGAQNIFAGTMFDPLRTRKPKT